MYNLGLKPKPQYKISNHTVDFAFPEVDLVVEVDGIHHRTQEQKERDRKREDIEEAYSWKIIRFNAEDVHKEPKYFANEIKKYIDRVKRKNKEEKKGKNLRKKDVLKTSPIIIKRNIPEDIVISFVIFIIILAIIFQLTGGGSSVFQNQGVRIYGLMFVVLLIGFWIYIKVKKMGFE